MLKKIKEDEFIKIYEYFCLDVRYLGCVFILYCLIKYPKGLRFSEIRKASLQLDEEYQLSKFQTHKAIKHLIDRDYLEKKKREKNGFSFNVYTPTDKAKKKQYIIIEIYKPLF